MGDTRLDQTIRMLGDGMDTAMFRRKLISSNVANAETPGYKAVDVDFAKQLQKAAARYQMVRAAGLSLTNPKHMRGAPLSSRVPIKSVENPHHGLRLDGNTVDLELEMAKMAENQFRFHALTTALNRVFVLLDDAVEGGGR